MEKLGKILLFILNIFINAFLIMVAGVLALWLFWGITPEYSVQRTLTWIEYKWDSLWGYSPKERTQMISPKYRKRAHRHLYVSEPNKRTDSTEEIITQPYK